jgi:hypothetical protein
MFIHLTFSFLYFLTFSSVFCDDKICTKNNCQLPCCQCAIINDNPTSLNITDIPQLVKIFIKKKKTKLMRI